MAKRRSPQKIASDKIIKKELNVLGEKIHNDATKNSRVDTGRLRDSQNFRVKPDTVLTVAQVFYGKFQDPDVLVKAVEKHVPKSTNIIITEITDQLLRDYKKT
jgi:hypothetical protein